MSQLIKDRVQQGRDAYRRHPWHEAFDSLREADSETPSLPKTSRYWRSPLDDRPWEILTLRRNRGATDRRRVFEPEGASPEIELR